MKIEHIAIWVQDLEKMKLFYTKYFKMQCSNKYINTAKNFSSYFLSFENSTCRIEIMNRPDIIHSNGQHASSFGLTHFAISVGGKDLVDSLTDQLIVDGYTLAGKPRITGDGYYESVVLDCEGNHVEITE